MYFPHHRTILYSKGSVKQALLDGTSVTEIAFNSSLSFCSARFLACHSAWHLRDSTGTIPTEMQDYSPPFSMCWLKSGISELGWRLVISAEHSQSVFSVLDSGSWLSACNTSFRVPVPHIDQAFWFWFCSPVPT